jgi:hypothetical protein
MYKDSLDIYFADLQNKHFLDHLEDASKQVDKWPEWKRNLLGGSKTSQLESI